MPDAAPIGASEPPIFFWRLRDSAIGWANQAACELWGAASSNELASRKLDRAMPAVARLQRLGLVLAEDASDEQELVFWLPRGSRSLLCWCRKVTSPSDGSGLVLTVLSVTDSPVSATPARPMNGSVAEAPPAALQQIAGRDNPPAAPPLAPEDAETLAEIARILRKPNGQTVTMAPQPSQSPPQSTAAGTPKPSPAEPELIGQLSHELRTPLNAIIGYGELLLAQQNGPLGSPKYKDYADNILAASKHCLSLVNDLFDMTRLAGGELRPEFSEVDVNEAARGCLAIMAPIAAKADVALSETLAASVPLAILDKRGLRQILLNLLANAVKFTPKGGRVEITSRYDVGVGLRVTVKDTGAGMTGSGLEAARGGPDSTEQGLSGLGLPISRKIANLNGGSLLVESQPGRGTKVTLFLPMNRLLLR